MTTKKDYNKEFKVTYGPSCRVTVNGQTMGYTGTDVYRLYGATDDNKKFSFGVTQSGKMEINSDMSIEMIAGEENSNKGEDILIHSRRGNISITADRNGCIKISGTHIAIEASGDMEISAGNELKLEATKLIIDANSAQCEAMDGNLAAEGDTFIEKATEGLQGIGGDIVRGIVKRLF
jgi:hypothetical protein